MQVLVWHDYLNKLNQLMKWQNRKILLLTDNTSTHLLNEFIQLLNINIL